MNQHGSHADPSRSGYERSSTSFKEKFLRFFRHRQQQDTTPHNQTGVSFTRRRRPRRFAARFRNGVSTFENNNKTQSNRNESDEEKNICSSLRLIEDIYVSTEQLGSVFCTKNEIAKTNTISVSTSKDSSQDSHRNADPHETVQPVKNTIRTTNTCDLSRSTLSTAAPATTTRGRTMGHTSSFRTPDTIEDEIMQPRNPIRNLSPQSHSQITTQDSSEHQCLEQGSQRSHHGHGHPHPHPPRPLTDSQPVYLTKRTSVPRPNLSYQVVPPMHSFETKNVGNYSPPSWQSVQHVPSKKKPSLPSYPVRDPDAVLKAMAKGNHYFEHYDVDTDTDTDTVAAIAAPTPTHHPGFSEDDYVDDDRLERILKLIEGQKQEMEHKDGKLSTSTQASSHHSHHHPIHQQQQTFQPPGMMDSSMYRSMDCTRLTENFLQTTSVNHTRPTHHEGFQAEDYVDDDQLEVLLEKLQNQNVAVGVTDLSACYQGGGNMLQETCLQQHLTYERIPSCAIPESSKSFEGISLRSTFCKHASLPSMRREPERTYSLPSLSSVVRM